MKVLILGWNLEKISMKEVKPRTPKPRLEPQHMMVIEKNGRTLEHFILLE
jgi:hypothetical protein